MEGHSRCLIVNLSEMSDVIAIPADRMMGKCFQIYSVTVVAYLDVENCTIQICFDLLKMPKFSHSKCLESLQTSATA